MRYTVSGRAQSFITAGLAILLALGVHLSAAHRADTHFGQSYASAPQLDAETGAAAARTGGA